MGAPRTLAIGLLGLCLMAQSARAADSTIPVGTRITPQNWQRYKDYMPQGLQTVLGGTTVWKVPADAVMEVGPTVDYPLPKSWYDASEKYKYQTKLKKLDTGGYTLEGYQAGTPFPDYSGPDEAYKIFYTCIITTAARSTITKATATRSTATSTPPKCFLPGLSDVHSHDRPRFSGLRRVEMPGYLSSYYDELEEPEQSKYTSPLELIFDDPQKIPEFYVFLPSLRRALRLSSSARCAPYAGGDTSATTSMAGFRCRWAGSKPSSWARKKC